MDATKICSLSHLESRCHEITSFVCQCRNCAAVLATHDKLSDVVCYRPPLLSRLENLFKLWPSKQLSDLSTYMPLPNNITPDIPYTLQWARNAPPKLPLSLGNPVDPPPNTWFLGSTRVHISTSQTESRFVQPFQHNSWSMVMSNRHADKQTDKPRRICSNRPHLCTPCM